ncbi:MAG: outer membrane protein assembly factor BamA [Bacteroidales bacterium]|nr:outer membrane protein assembly factor BamA [Bacteroidales bacterium]
MFKFLYVIISGLMLSLVARAQESVFNDSIWSDEKIERVSYSGMPRKYTIAEINVTGIENMDQKVLQNLSGLRVGQEIAIPGDAITQALKRYWNHGMFSDVKIYQTKVEDRQVWLEIALKERPRLSDINFHGVKRSEIKDVEPKVAIMKETQVTPFLITRAEKYVKSFFHEKGYYNVDVNIVQRNDPYKDHHVILDVFVDKKEKVKVNSLTFTGNKAFSYRKLNRAMKKTNAKKLYNFFRTKKFIKENYENDKIALIEKYNEAGYRDAYIISDEVVPSEKKENRVDVTVNINEGRKYYIGNITWVGNTVYSSDFLQNVFGMKKGDVYNSKKMNKRLKEDDDAVHNFYMDNGYLFSNITPIESNVYGDTIDIEMRIIEGTQATINEIVINGNDKTHEHVARREIRTKPGQLFSKSELIRTVRELAQLGHFNPEAINPVPQPNQDNGTVDIVYNLEEKSNDQIEVSGGWGAGMFVGSVGLSFNNFSLRNLFNKEAYSPLPTGDGQKLGIKAQANGKNYKSLSVSFTEPWLGGKRPNSLSLSAFYSSQTGVSKSYYNNFYNGYQGGYGATDVPDRKSIQQYRKVSGFSVGFGKRLTWPDDWFVLYTEFSYQLYRLKNWQYFLMQNGQSHNLNFRVTLSRNSTDNPIYTRSGSNFSIGVSFTPPYSAFSNHNWRNERDDQTLYKVIEYHKWSLRGQVFKPLDDAHKLIIMGKFEMGFLGYYNRYKKSPFEKYVMGGDGMSGYSTYGEETIGLRGYENSSLTPRTYSNGAYSYNGNVYNKYTMEIRYPISLQPQATVYALGFAEAGNCWSEFQDYSPFDLKRSAGVGVRIFLPMFGLLGVDWGYGFDSVAGYNKAGGSQFHFVMGQSF